MDVSHEQLNKEELLRELEEAINEYADNVGDGDEELKGRIDTLLWFTGFKSIGEYILWRNDI